MYTNEIRIASLLHDIGKFYQKAGKDIQEIKVIKDNGYSIQHSLISAHFIEVFRERLSEYVDVGIVKELVQRHHENDYGANKPEILVKNAPKHLRKYCLLVSEADNISSSERDEKEIEGKHYVTTPLASIFTRMQEGVNPDMYEFGEYTVNNIYTKLGHTKNDKKDNERHITKFHAEFKEMLTKKHKDCDSLVIEIDRLLKKYTWCVPSAFQDKITDVSLYDHLRTTHAIANCMMRQLEYLTDKDDNFNEAAIRNCEFTLVQFEIRGILDYIMSINQTGITNNFEYRMAGRQKNANNLGLKIATRVVNELGLTNLNNVVHMGNKYILLIPECDKDTCKNILINKSKQILKKYGSKLTLVGNSITVKNKDFEHMNDIIDKLSKNKINTFGTQDLDILENGTWNRERFILERTEEEQYVCKFCEQALIISKDDMCESCKKDESTGKDVLSKENNNVTITDIINKNDKLAIIRLDVDNLRKYTNDFFGTGYASISRLSTMSRMLKVFLTSCVENICKQQKQPACVILAESDDIILFTRLDNAMRLAYKIRNEFRKYTSKGLELTGVVYQMNKKETIYNAIQNTELRLFKAKEQSKNKKRGGIEYRGRHMSYAEVKEYCGMALELKALSENMSSGILERIAKYSGMYKKYVQTGDGKYMIAVSLFDYDKNRNKAERGFIEDLFKSDLKDRININTKLYNLESAIIDIKQYKMNL